MCTKKNVKHEPPLCYYAENGKLYVCTFIYAFNLSEYKVYINKKNLS